MSKSGLSHMDISIANHMYGCTGEDNASTVVIVNNHEKYQDFPYKVKR